MGDRGVQMPDSFFCKYEEMVSLLSYGGIINTYLSHVAVRIIKHVTYVTEYKPTLEILWVWFQTTAVR